MVAWATGMAGPRTNPRVPSGHAADESYGSAGDTSAERAGHGCTSSVSSGCVSSRERMHQDAVPVFSRYRLEYPAIGRDDVGLAEVGKG